MPKSKKLIGFSTADADYPKIIQENGDLTLRFKDREENVIEIFFDDYIAFKWQLAVSLFDGERDDCSYEIIDSEWLKLHYKQEIIGLNEEYCHYKFNFNCVGQFEVLAQRYIVKTYKTIEEKIKAIEWRRYLGPEHYDPEELVQSLLQLSIFDETNAKHGLDNKVLFAVGNNHAGTYYPAILEAADLIIEMEKHSNLENVRKCASAILNNLYYFQPELGAYSKHSAEEIMNFVKSKLSEYADET